MTKILCENCGNEHDGTYGSGRFCNTICSHSYSSNSKKEQTSKKISIAMKKRWARGPHISEEKLKTIGKKGLEKQRQNRELLYEHGSWDELPLTFKKRRALEEQNDKCLICGINEWQGKPITLHFDHIDGDNNNNSRENVRFICPNCHSQTETYCGNKQKLPQFEHLKTTKERLNQAA